VDKQDGPKKFKVVDLDGTAKTEQEIMTGMIVDDKICAGIVPMLSRLSFRTVAMRKVAEWVQEYHLEFGKAPGRDIEMLFEQRRNSLDDAQAHIVETMLADLSAKFKDLPTGQRLLTYSPEAMIARASGYFAGNIEADFAGRMARLRARGQFKDADKLRDIDLPAAIAKLGIGTATTPFELKTLFDLKKEVDKLPPIGWVVHELMTDNGMTIFASRPKVGKSRLVANLTAQVIRGLQFLGRPTSQGPVFYFQTPEEGDKRRLVQIFHNLGLTQEQEEKLLHLYCDAVPDNPLQKFEQMVIEYKPVMAVIDSLSGFYNIQNINDNSEMSRLIKPFAAIARKHFCNIVFIMHLTKYRGNILGATSIEGGPDTLFYLRARGEEEEDDGDTLDQRPRSIRSKNRYGEAIEKALVLDYDKVTGIITAGDTVAQQNAKLLWQEMVHLLRDGNPHTVDELKQATSAAKERLLKTLDFAMDGHRITRTGTGRKGDPFRFALVAAAPVPLLRRPDRKLIEQAVEKEENRKESEEIGDQAVDNQETEKGEMQ
jgi:hypothetical protein